MRITTFFLTITALALSGAAVAGGQSQHATGQGMQKQGTKAESLAKIDNQNVVQVFNNTDKDDNFKISKEEAGRIEGLQKRFSELDKDGDGALDYAEFRSVASTRSDR